MKFHPIKRDSRYSIEREFCGHAKPRFVLRFCGEFIASSDFYQSMVIRAAGHNSARLGAIVIEERQ